MALLDDFKARFPEFSVPVADQYVPILEPIWPCYWNGEYDTDECTKEIVLNLLGHLITVETSSGSGNVKTTASKSVGSVSVSYDAGFAASSERVAWFKTTKYGARYLLLTRPRQGAVFV